MKSKQTRHKRPQGFRKSLGKAVGFILRKEYQFLIRKGLSASVAKKLAIFINLCIIISLLFILFPMWMGLVTLIIGALLLAGVDIDVSPPDHKYQYRGGTDGFGKYDNESGFRVDCGSIDDEDTYMGKED